MPFALSSINTRSDLLILPPSIHNLFTIHLAIPRKRQCIGSTIRCLIGLKYGNLNISDHRTRLAETWVSLSSRVLQYRQASAFVRCSSGSRSWNHSDISSNPPKFDVLPTTFALL